MCTRDQCKTAFVCHEGMFEFKRLPFGLKNASQCFQNLVDIVLKPLNSDCSRKCYYPYIDDIVIHSPDVQTHLKDLHAVFQCLRDAGLTVNSSKCVFMCKEVFRLLGRRRGYQARPIEMSSSPKLPCTNK